MRIIKDPEEEWMYVEDEHYNIIRVETEMSKQKKIERNKKRKIEKMRKQINRRDKINRITSMRIVEILLIILTIIGSILFVLMCGGYSVWSMYPNY